MDGQPPGQGPIDTEAIARYRSALFDPEHGHGRDLEDAAAREVLATWSRARGQILKAWMFHLRALRWALGDREPGGMPWPLARSAVFTAAGYPPRERPGKAVHPAPHAEAAALWPAARFGYADASESITLLWQARLHGDPAASAWQGAASDPAAVLAGAVAAGMRPPWQVHIPLCLHWWPAGHAEWVLGEWARLLRRDGPGSSLAITAAVPGTTPAAARISGVLEEVAGVPVAYRSCGQIGDLVAGAGLRLHPLGVRDVRLPWTPRPAEEAAARDWPCEALGDGTAPHLVDLVALVPRRPWRGC